MICLLHGWLLEGSGSNLWTRAVVKSLCRRGETVHLVCQENHPERYDFISAAFFHRLDGSIEQTFARDTDLPGKCVLHKPELAGVLPVFVWDKYEEHERVVPMVELSTEEIERYTAINVRVVRRVAEEHGVTVVHANHAVMMPVVAERIRAAMGIPFTIMPHGSGIEYAVKKDERFLAYAAGAFEAASAVLVIGDEMRARVMSVFAGVPGIADKLVDLHLGVDTSQFALATREERPAEIALLRRELAKLPYGKTAAQDERLDPALADARDFRSLKAALGAVSEYDGKRPDERAGEKLSAVEWSSAPTLLFVGRLIAAKGIQSLIAALPVALAEVPGLRTIVVGHGPLREVMEALVWALREGRRDVVRLIADRGRELEGGVEDADGDPSLKEVVAYLAALESRGELDDYFAAARRNLTAESVRFTGYLTHNELRHLFPCCDVGVFPSVVREAGPLVFLEALASGCFPLGTYFGGMAGSIDAVAGDLSPDAAGIMRLDPANTVRDLAVKIPAAVREGPRFRETLARVAREKYDWSSVSAKLLEVLKASEARGGI